MDDLMKEMMGYIEDDEEFLAHYGMPRRSGRYPWGSGEDPYQHTEDFLSRVDALKKSGWEETPENIKKEFGMSTTQYRTEKSLAKDSRRMHEVARAKSLAQDGLSPTEIGRIMNRPESSIRSLLNSDSESRMKQAKNTADFIRKSINEKGMIDVGVGVERELGVSREKFNEALAILENEGYPIFGGRVPQATNPGKKTTIKVICPPGTPHSDIYDYNKVNSLNKYVSHDDGETFDTFVYPKSMDSKRLKILLADEINPTDGEKGIQKDGLIQIRRNVPDLSLGEDHYSQVRILVDNNKYLKGMAVYSDNMPDGVDVIFNTNKTDYAKALKDIKSDPENPFGSLIKPGGQSYYIDENGNRQLSLINKRASEGDWTEWKDALPSQFLGKQSLSLAKKQLKLAADDKISEYNELLSLTNPTIKKYMLNKFAEECDSAAVHLQAAALPGQKYHVIVPINSLTKDEVFAPNYKDGTKLALIRYPHGGTFEIPILTVNNKNKTAIDVIGLTSIDAVGINKSVADRLSGADFDGDTVMCIPTHNGRVKISNRDNLEGLENFDPKVEYGYDREETDANGVKHYYRGDHEFKPMTNTQNEMGRISNLINDMTIKGANDIELAAAVRHSMVVIDAEKHHLDYKQSELDNNIEALKKNYQISIDENGEVHYGGASTLLSRSKGQASVIKRQGTPVINAPTINGKDNPYYDPSKPLGSLIYKIADDAYYTEKKTNQKTGEVNEVTKVRMQRSTKMAETDDARSLISDFNSPMEQAYAEYANQMKKLANDARIEILNTGNLEYKPNAKETYKNEVASLDAKLNEALLNSPRERAAQLQAATIVKERERAMYEEAKEKNKDLNKKIKIDKASLRKTGQQALTKYRNEFGSIARKKRSIKISDSEWEAIQAGAISENKLKKILANTDADSLRERATPRTSTTLTPAKISKIQSMRASGKSTGQIAEALGISVSTVSKYMKGGN